MQPPRGENIEQEMDWVENLRGTQIVQELAVGGSEMARRKENYQKA